MATRDEIADFLEDASVGVVGTTLFKGQFPPETPDACGAVIDASGLKPIYALGGSVAYERPKVQVRFRGVQDDYATPRALAEMAYRALLAVANQTINSTRYIAITPIQTPFAMDRDKKGRFEVGFTVECEKALSS